MTILFVENHARFARLCTQTFLSTHTVTVVPSVQASCEELTSNSFDIALVDYDLDDGKGDEVVRFIQLEQPQTTIIAVSSHERGNAAKLAAGAHGVCAKLQFKEIESAISIARERRLENQADGRPQPFTSK